MLVAEVQYFTTEYERGELTMFEWIRFLAHSKAKGRDRAEEWESIKLNAGGKQQSIFGTS